MGVKHFTDKAKVLDLNHLFRSNKNLHAVLITTLESQAKLQLSRPLLLQKI